MALHDRLHANSPPLRQWLYGWTALASLLAVGVMALARDLRLPALAVALLSLYFAAVTATMTVPLYRFRMVLEPYLVVVLACGALHGQRILSTRLRRP